MPPLAVVELLDGRGDLAPRLPAGGPARLVPQLDLQRREETLGHGVIPAVAAAAHAADDPVGPQDAPIVGARVLAASIRVCVRPFSRTQRTTRWEPRVSSYAAPFSSCVPKYISSGVR